MKYSGGAAGYVPPTSDPDSAKRARELRKALEPIVDGAHRIAERRTELINSISDKSIRSSALEHRIRIKG